MRRLTLICAFVMLATQAFSACVGSTEVRKVYPTTDLLPENLLRIYVYFSAPMRHDVGVEHIVIKDASGAIVPEVFLPTRYALWSPDRKRLTVMLDPGRVKTGLDAHDAKGRALQSGQSYTLVVNPTMLDQSGCLLTAPFEKAFEAGHVDFEIPSPSDWSFEVPKAGTSDPLSVKLNGSHDHLSLAYGLRVRNGNGETVRGRIGVSDGESTWLFQPSDPWVAASYTITVDAKFEDLAGNRTAGLFDDPTGQARVQQQTTGPVEVNFTVR
ncbi:MAG: Ig-like domain-containing protein [Pseudomonadota bacterium]